nr:MAG TPA: hypothetical protein [Caudoviricetes sp.]
MTKKQKAQLLEKLIADVKRENKNVYFSETNEGRMAAAQRGMYALGQIIGLAGGDLFNYNVESLQAELIDKFGEWAFRPGCWFQSISDERCAEMAAEHRATKKEDA